MDVLTIIALFSGVTGLTLSIGMARAYTKLVVHLREKNVIDPKFDDGLNWRTK